jgi:hypothetical protein
MPLCPNISIAVLSSSGIENRSKTKNQTGFKKNQKNQLEWVWLVYQKQIGKISKNLKFEKNNKKICKKLDD